MEIPFTPEVIESAYRARIKREMQNELEKQTQTIDVKTHENRDQQKNDRAISSGREKQNRGLYHVLPFISIHIASIDRPTLPEAQHSIILRIGCFDGYGNG